MSPEELKHYTKKFKDYFNPKELKHFTKKELIKSSKRIGNSKQNDNLITEEDLVYLSPEELKHYTKKFKDYFNPKELKHFTKKELIKSSKRIGNSKQNDNLITEEDLIYFDTKDFTKKLFEDFKKIHEYQDMY